MTNALPAVEWVGVLPALTTPFTASLEVDYAALRAHADWLARSGCRGLIVGGSLGEGATLTSEERAGLVREAVAAVGASVPVIGSVASARTADAVRLARACAAEGARALMVLPPYLYHGSWPETREHFAEVLRATELPCMLYNNPPAYGTDVLPDQLLELATDHPNLTALKESTGDVRRITAVRALLGDRIAVAVGVDDAVLEGAQAGATAWVSGLANALPVESVELWRRASQRDTASALPIYRWLLPLLRMDTGPHFVQLLKLVQAEVGRGTPRVRGPRRELEGTELASVRATVREVLGRRPEGLAASSR